jgi:hypothetical protein
MKKESKKQVSEKLELVPATAENKAALAVSVSSFNSILTPVGASGVPDGFTRIGIPDVLPIREMQAGVMVTGVVIAEVESPVAEYNTKLLHLRHASGQEFCFPLGTVLEGKIKSLGGFDKIKGKEIAIKKTGEKPSKRFSAKSYNVFEFFVKDGK